MFLFKSFEMYPQSGLFHAFKSIGSRRIESFERSVEAGQGHEVLSFLLQPKSQVFRPLKILLQKWVRILFKSKKVLDWFHVTG